MGIVLLSVTVLSFLPQDGFDLKASMERGKEVYATYCLSCHMEEGEGLEGVYPPVAKSDYMMADVKRSIISVIHGATKALLFCQKM